MSNPAINGSNINEKKTEMAKSTQTIAMFYSRWDAMASGCHASWPRRSKFCRQRKSSDGLTLSSHSTFVSSVPRREVTNPKLLDRLISKYNVDTDLELLKKFLNLEDNSLPHS